MGFLKFIFYLILAIYALKLVRWLLAPPPPSETKAEKRQTPPASDTFHATDMEKCPKCGVWFSPGDGHNCPEKNT